MSHRAQLEVVRAMVDVLCERLTAMYVLESKVLAERARRSMGQRWRAVGRELKKGAA